MILKNFTTEDIEGTEEKWGRIILMEMNYPAASSGVSLTAMNAPRGGE